MRDVHSLQGKKQYFETIEEATLFVQKHYPTANTYGSLGSYHWEDDGYLVAEAWVHRTKPGYWLRIARTENDKRPI